MRNLIEHFTLRTMDSYYEDEYRKQIFEQMCRLQDRGEDVTNAHRADDQRAFQIRQINDEIDHLDWKDRMRQKMHRMRLWGRNRNEAMNCPPDMQTFQPVPHPDATQEKSPVEDSEKETPEEAFNNAPILLPPVDADSFSDPLRPTRYSSDVQRRNPGSKNAPAR